MNELSLFVSFIALLLKLVGRKVYKYRDKCKQMDCRERDSFRN